MPKRLIPLITSQIYHIYNRSIDGIPIFSNKKTVNRTLDAIKYYKLIDTPVKLSYFLHWPADKKNNFNKESITKNKNYITLFAYCLMPNHFHLLLRQERDNGISKFMSNIQNSITRYVNSATKRKGHIFQGQFKSVLIESNEQLLHVSRYIHLNPFNSYIVKNIESLEKFMWSSLYEYLNGDAQLCNTKLILSNFKDPQNYWKFIKDQSDYQRKLESIKHLILE